MRTLGMRLATLAGVCLFLSSPWISPDQRLAASTAELHREDETMLGCPVDGYPSALSIFNNSTSPSDVEVAGIGSGAFITATTVLPGSGTSMPLPPGYEGAVTVTSDQPVVGIMNVFGDGTPDSPGAFYECQDASSGSVLLFPFLQNGQWLYLNNLGSGPIDLVSYAYAHDGEQSTKPDQTTVPAQDKRIITFKDAGGKNFATPANILTFRNSSGLFNTYTVPLIPTGMEPPDLIGGVGFTEAITDTYVFLPGQNAGVIGGTVNVQSHFSGDYPITMTVMTPGGGTTGVVTGLMPGQGTAGVSALFDSSAAVLKVEGSDISANFSSFGPQNDRAVDSKTGMWPAVSLAERITKKGFAFGLPSTQKSKVSFVAHNIGNKKAKVKYRIINGDTGKKVQSGTAKVSPDGTAEVPFKKRARGTNLWVQITVKGKTAVLAGLLRNYKGDLDFVPAFPR